MKALLSLSVFSLLLGSFIYLSQEEASVSRGPASFEKRTLNIKKEREERIVHEQKEQELLKLYAEIESLKAELQSGEEGLLQLQYYMTSPSTELATNNEALAQYLALNEKNMTPYQAPVFNLGEMNSEGEALYYGLPFSARKAIEIEATERSYYYPISNPGSYIISVQ